MARFKRLTDAEARTLTRRELLDRIEAEQAYWFKGTRAREDSAGFREFTRIMHAYLSPASIAEAMQDTIDHIEGRSPGGYWDTRPGDVPAPGARRAVDGREPTGRVGVRDAAAGARAEPGGSVTADTPVRPR